jgi:heterotetrameric sarcosine oxidase gamma subunit
VSDGKLAAMAALGTAEAVNESWEGFEMAELPAESRFWLAVPAGGAEKLSKACATGLGTELPAQGRFGDGAKGRIFWAGDGQYLVTTGLKAMPAPVEKAGHATDQSDGWVGVRVSGRLSRRVLEKLCPLDLHESVFPDGSAARAPMETMMTLIACENASAGTYAIYFQRSSARSFIGHLRHAAESTVHAN